MPIKREQVHLKDHFQNDHTMIGALLNAAVIDDQTIDTGKYDEFRRDLLRHIAIEEKILIPFLLKTKGNIVTPLADQLRLEHGAIAALLVLPPGMEVKKVLTALLRHHNKKEEADDGLYEDCDYSLAGSGDVIMHKIMKYPEVPLMPCNGSDLARSAVRRAITRAGYEYNNLLAEMVS